MKHVRALSAEPVLLATYRSDYPNEETRPENEASATWEDFKTAQAAYKQVLDELARAQQGLCIYCEQLLVDASGKLVSNDYQVEHVQAKSGAVGRVLAWRNLALACTGGTYPHHREASRQFTNALNTSCGQTKGDGDLPPSCDPRSIPLAGALVEAGIDGKLAVNARNCAAAGVSAAEVEAALLLLNLDCERLRKARQDRRDNINAWVVALLEELLLSSHLNVAQRQQMLDLLIAGRLQPDASSGYLRAFWTTERCALGPDAETWIANHGVLFS
jgi:uncharacterized protein (TIGR02646 family)